MYIKKEGSTMELGLLILLALVAIFLIIWGRIAHKAVSAASRYIREEDEKQRKLVPGPPCTHNPCRPFTEDEMAQARQKAREGQEKDPIFGWSVPICPNRIDWS